MTDSVIGRIDRKEIKSYEKDGETPPQVCYFYNQRRKKYTSFDLQFVDSLQEG